MCLSIPILNFPCFYTVQDTVSVWEGRRHQAAQQLLDHHQQRQEQQDRLASRVNRPTRVRALATGKINFLVFSFLLGFELGSGASGSDTGSFLTSDQMGKRILSFKDITCDLW